MTHTHYTYACLYGDWRRENNSKRYFVANWTHTQFKPYFFLLIRGLFGATISVIVVTFFCWGLHLWTLFMQWIYANCNNGFEANASHFHSFALAHLTHSSFCTQNAIDAFFFWCKYVFMNCSYSLQFASIFEACAKCSLSLFIHFIIQFVWIFCFFNNLDTSMSSCLDFCVHIKSAFLLLLTILPFSKWFR